jgi:hypothetical protein
MILCYNNINFYAIYFDKFFVIDKYLSQCREVEIEQGSIPWLTIVATILFLNWLKTLNTILKTVIDSIGGIIVKIVKLKSLRKLFYCYLAYSIILIYGLLKLVSIGSLSPCIGLIYSVKRQNTKQG